MKLYNKTQIKAAHERVKEAEKAFNDAKAARDKSLADAAATRLELDAKLSADANMATAGNLTAHDRSVETMKARLDAKLSTLAAELETARGESALANQTEAARGVLLDAVARVRNEPARMKALFDAVGSVKSAALAVSAKLTTGADKDLLREPVLAAAQEVADDHARALLVRSVSVPQWKSIRNNYSSERPSRVDAFSAPRALACISPAYLTELRTAKAELIGACEALDNAIKRAEELKGADSVIRSKARHRMRPQVWESVVRDVADDMLTLVGDKNLNELLVKLDKARQAPRQVVESVKNEFDPKTGLNSIKKTVTTEKLLPIDAEKLETAERTAVARIGKILGRNATAEDLSVLERYAQNTTTEDRQMSGLGKQESESARGGPGLVFYAKWANILGEHEAVKARIESELDRAVDQEFAETIGAPSAQTKGAA